MVERAQIVLNALISGLVQSKFGHSVLLLEQLLSPHPPSGVGPSPRALSVKPPVHPWRLPPVAGFPVARWPRSVDHDELLPVPEDNFLRRFMMKTPPRQPM